MVCTCVAHDCCWHAPQVHSLSVCKQRRMMTMFGMHVVLGLCLCSRTRTATNMNRKDSKQGTFSFLCELMACRGAFYFILCCCDESSIATYALHPPRIGVSPPPTRPHHVSSSPSTWRIPHPPVLLRLSVCRPPITHTMVIPSSSS